MKLLFLSKQNFLKKTGRGGDVLSGEIYNLLKDIVGRDNLFLIMFDPASAGERFDTDKNELVIQQKRNEIKKNINYLCLRDEMNFTTEWRIRKAVIDFDPDVVFFDGSWLGRLAVSRCVKGRKVIVFYHNIEKYIVSDWIKRKGLIGIPRYLSNIYNEKVITANSGNRLCLNERDSEILLKYYGVGADMIFPIFLKRKKCQEQRNEGRRLVNNLLFVGSDYYPNVEGIRWFCKNVMPKVNCRLQIVGKGMDRYRSELSNEKVEVKGYVDDLEEVYRTSDLVVLPIFAGGGMKVKTAEALSYGRLIAGTSEALEGYHFTPNNLVWYCNDAKGYISIISQLQERETDAFCWCNYELYSQQYSYESAYKKMSGLLGEM